MKDIVKSKDEHYEYTHKLQKLLMKRDTLKKKMITIKMDYIRIFGELRMEEFNLQVQIIRLKKEIVWIVRKQNAHEAVDLEQMKSEIDQQMNEYKMQIAQMAKEYALVSDAKECSKEELSKIRHIYHRIAKRIHPDLHPRLADNEDVSLIWHAACLAYELNDLEELENLEVQLNFLMEEIESDEQDYEFTFDPEKRIERIQEQIDELNQDPVFDLCKWIDTEEGQEQRRSMLNQNIETLKAYIDSLEEKKREVSERSRSCLIH
ncbi:hypothetical protein [Ileibacterium valens]|uniref:hypothetical protein n=1 Tax=Ileibacterium valens TaxID=1862668 RepID=UPI00259BF2E2|nr:hypothetical protein [Ileibacterium valens]